MFSDQIIKPISLKNIKWLKFIIIINLLIVLVLAKSIKSISSFCLLIMFFKLLVSNPISMDKKI
jgi:hypothetical protein